MRKREFVRICDHCGMVVLEEWGLHWDRLMKGAPKGWTKLGQEDLCPECSEIYRRFQNEVSKETNL